MGKVWVLDTETKGTGAEMVPLERLEQRKRGERSKADTDRVSVLRRERQHDHEESAEGASVVEAPARRFKVENVVTRQVLADDVEARGAIAALRSVRRVTDAYVAVWEPDEERWRSLTFDEKKALWSFRDRLESPQAD